MKPRCRPNVAAAADLEVVRAVVGPAALGVIVEASLFLAADRADPVEQGRGVRAVAVVLIWPV